MLSDMPHCGGLCPHVCSPFLHRCCHLTSLFFNRRGICLLVVMPHSGSYAPMYDMPAIRYSCTIVVASHAYLIVRGKYALSLCYFFVAMPPLICTPLFVYTIYCGRFSCSCSKKRETCLLLVMPLLGEYVPNDMHAVGVPLLSPFSMLIFEQEGNTSMVVVTPRRTRTYARNLCVYQSSSSMPIV